MKSKIVGAIAVAASFGVGFAIPNVASAVNQIDSYEEAKAIVEGTQNRDNGESVAEENISSEAVSDVHSGENQEAPELVSKETEKESKDKASNEKESGKSTNPDADVVLGFTFDDIEVNGVKFVDADYDSMLKVFGLDNLVQVEYTDGGFKINHDAVEWNGKEARRGADYRDENTKQTSMLFYDGEKYVTNDLDEKEPDRYTISISGSWEDKDNYSDYWTFGYITEIENSGKTMLDDVYVGNYEHGLSEEEIKEIGEFMTAPFIGGDYEAMNEVMHTDEMIEKGLKDESGSFENQERYIVDTSLGKCSLNVSTSENNNGKVTYYHYEFENGKYVISIGFNEGLIATGVDYHYRH